MSTIVKRITKGTTLTLAELDANINNLNVGKLEVSGGTLTGRPKLANQDIDIIEPKYPTIKPSLNLDFVSSRQLDPRVTFARNSTAAYYDGKTTAKAEENLLKYSQDFSNSAGGIWYKSNLATTAASSIAPDGTNTATLITPSNASWQLSQALESGSIDYTISVYAKVDSGTATFRLYGKNTLVVSGDLTVTTTWQRFTFSYVGAAGNSSGLIFSSAGNVTPFYLWGAQLEQRSSVTAYTPTTTAPITNYIPVLKFAQPNVPRLDYDPISGKALGLLIEEQRANLLPYSNYINTGVWANNSYTSLLQNQIIAPDGTLTASYMSSNNYAGVYYGAAGIATAGTPYTFSIHFKYSSGAGKISISLASALSGSSAIDPQTLAITNTGSAIGTLVSSNGNGWYRFSVTFMSYYVTDYPVIGHMGASLTGIYYWGLQLESGASQAIRNNTIGAGSTTSSIVLDSGASSVDGTYVGNKISIGFEIKTISAYVGSTKTATVSIALPSAPSSGTVYIITPATMTVPGFATSYIPTTTGAVTRFADQASMTGTNFSSWYNIYQGSMYAEYDIKGLSVYAGVFWITDISTWNRGISLVNNPNNTPIYFGTGSTGLYTSSSLIPVVNIISKAVVTYTNISIGLCLNSVNASQTITPNSPFYGTIYIGRQMVAGEDKTLTGHIRKLTYYPKALTSTELVALTS